MSEVKQSTQDLAAGFELKYEAGSITATKLPESVDQDAINAAIESVGELTTAFVQASAARSHAEAVADDSIKEVTATMTLGGTKHNAKSLTITSTWERESTVKIPPKEKGGEATEETRYGRTTVAVKTDYTKNSGQLGAVRAHWQAAGAAAFGPKE